MLEDLQTAARLHSAATGQHWEPVDVAAMDTFGLNTVVMTPLDSLDEDLQFNCNRWSLSWALRNLSGVSQGIYKSVVQSGREFLRIGVAGRPGETLWRQPQVAPRQGDGVHEGRRRFVVPSSSAVGHGVAFLQRVGGQGGPGKEAQQDRRGAGDGPVGPLALGLHAQVGPHLLKGDLQLLAQDKPFQDLVGSADGSVHSRACGVKAPWGSRINTQRMHTGGLPERYRPRSGR